MMPDGLVANLTPGELADLIAYLQSLTGPGTDKKPDAVPVQMTAQQDHRRLMNLLKIQSLRRGPSGNPRAANAANFDEAKANPYPDLPDPLVMKTARKSPARRCGGSSGGRKSSRTSTAKSMAECPGTHRK